MKIVKSASDVWMIVDIRVLNPVSRDQTINQDLVSSAYLISLYHTSLPSSIPRPLSNTFARWQPLTHIIKAQASQYKSPRTQTPKSPPRTARLQHNFINMSTTPLSDDESAQWVRFTLKKLTHLAISARLIGPAALDAEGLLCDKRLCRDLVSV